MVTISLLPVFMTSLLIVPYCPTGAWCDFETKTPYEEKPCELWKRPPATDERPGFVVHRAGGLPWKLQPQANDTFGSYVGEYHISYILKLTSVDLLANIIFCGSTLTISIYKHYTYKFCTRSKLENLLAAHITANCGPYVLPSTQIKCLHVPNCPKNAFKSNSLCNVWCNNLHWFSQY